MRSVREMTEAQRFLERYASTPTSSIDKDQAQANLRKIGILTTSNRVSSRYAHVVVKTEIKRVKAENNGHKKTK